MDGGPNCGVIDHHPATTTREARTPAARAGCIEGDGMLLS